ncbi:hypothetical protein GPECTOR_22g888 [Gonium pectorale]|uniref:Uncharacterized protein n=1 Tax=Gonium pectorale TaxID=33097 RepID=A0A150GHJ3_GONPE|nr:hypothetical protein GPECTOR_22g888 [Gonium pectorale]|eukprot:KXZ49294.1 hypothetical protein GPECTOR_22g888 [Gonium pectorale]
MNFGYEHLQNTVLEMKQDNKDQQKKLDTAVGDMKQGNMALGSDMKQGNMALGSDMKQHNMVMEKKFDTFVSDVKDLLTGFQIGSLKDQNDVLKAALFRTLPKAEPTGNGTASAGGSDRAANSQAGGAGTPSGADSGAVEGFDKAGSQADSTGAKGGFAMARDSGPLT